MSEIMISLADIAAYDPCAEGWARILYHRRVITQEVFDLYLERSQVPYQHIVSASTEQFPLSEALISNGLFDTVWAMRCLPQHDELWRRFSVWLVRSFDEENLKDPRSLAVLSQAQLHSEGFQEHELLRRKRLEACEAAEEAYDVQQSKGNADQWRAYAAAARAAHLLGFTPMGPWVQMVLRNVSAVHRYGVGRDRRDETAADKMLVISMKLRQVLNAGAWVE